MEDNSVGDTNGEDMEVENVTINREYGHQDGSENITQSTRVTIVKEVKQIVYKRNEKQNSELGKITDI